MTAKNEVEVAKMEKVIETLHKEGSETYIRLQQIASFQQVDKTIIVPTDSRLFVPIGNLDNDKKLNNIIPDNNK